MKQSTKHLLLTVLVALVGISASAANYDFEVDGIYYNVVSSSDFTCEVARGGEYYGSTDWNMYSGDISIPETVSHDGSTYKVVGIGENAFQGCSGLTSLTMGDNVATIGHYAFDGCTGLKSLPIGNKVTYIDDHAFSDCSNAKSVVIPNGMTTIGNYVFKDCTSLTSIDIPNSVTEIGYEAFFGCSKLTYLKVPSSVTNLEEGVALESGVEVIEIGNGITELPLDYYEYNNEYSYETLFWESENDYECEFLYKIVIADSENALAVPTFEGAGMKDINRLPALKELYIGRNLETREDTSYPRYISNTKVRKIEYGDLCTAEENVAECTSLEEIVYGKGISSVNAYHISENSLAAIYAKAQTPPAVSGSFSNNTYKNVKLYVPKESLSAYKAADVWKNFLNIEGYDFPSGISAPTIDKADQPTAIYDLNGRRLTSPQKGLNIINGKKVFVK